MSSFGELYGTARKLAVRLARDREARIVLAFALLSIVGGFFGNRLLTQVAQPASLGTYYLYANLAQWLSMPAAAGFVYIVHHWPIAREHGDTRRFSRAITIAIVLQGFVAILGVVGFRLSGRVAIGDLEAMSGVALLAFGGGVFQLLCPMPGAERWRGWGGALGLLGGNARPVAQAIGIVLFGATTGIGLLASSAALQIVAALLAAYLFVRIFRVTRSAEPPRQTDQLSFNAFLSYSIPGFFGVFIPQIASSIERWGLAISRDTAATALFVQAMGMSLAVTGAVSGVIVNYFYPFVTNAAARDTADPIGAAAPVLKQFYGVLAAALGAIAILVVIFVRQVTWLAFGARFASIAPLLPWTVVGASLFALGAALSVTLFVARSAFWPNFARIASQLAYVAALIFIPSGVDPAASFVREYVGAQLVYALIIGWAIWRSVTARRARLAQQT